MINKDSTVTLRKFNISDSKRLAELANNKNISINLRDRFPHPYTEIHAESFITRCLEQNPTTIFAIQYNNEYVGNIGLVVQKDVYRKSAEIGFFIGENYWNKGIATEAIKQIISYGINELDVIRIYADIFEYSIPSMRVLEKCGFEKEGIAKRSVIKNGKVRDQHRFAYINPGYND